MEDGTRLLEEGGVTDVIYSRYVQIMESYNEARAKLETGLERG